MSGSSVHPSARPQIVVVGAGFAGLAATRALARAEADVTVVDRCNHHLFQPLLYQVATAALSPADIAWPVRSLLSAQANARAVMGEVVGVDRAARAVRLADGAVLPFDWLVLATGARHAYFGCDEWARFAPGLKTIEDATAIRRRILTAFETAEASRDAIERRKLLTFVVVGGGPTGVELAGAIAELAKRTLACDFRRIDPRATRVVLVEAGPRILPAFPEPLSAIARKDLERLGVDVLLGAPVIRCDAEGVALRDVSIRARTVIWAAGVMASPAGKWLGAGTDAQGRVKVAQDLSLPDDRRIFVIGDAALAVGPEGRPAPGVAPAAKQMGAYVGRLIAAELAGKAPAEPFRYRDQGLMATIGRGAAVAKVAGLPAHGLPAWMLWAVAHVYFLIGARNRIIVSLNWAWSYVSHARGARLITGAPPPQVSPPADDQRESKRDAA